VVHQWKAHRLSLQAAAGAPLADSGLQVVHAIQIGDQARPGWLPVELLLCERARGRLNQGLPNSRLITINTD
jgi:hypothetical protein